VRGERDLDEEGRGGVFWWFFSKDVISSCGGEVLGSVEKNKDGREREERNI